MVPLFPSLAMVKHVHIAPRQATSCDARTATWAYGTDHCRPGPIFPHAPLPNFSGRWRQVTPGTNSCERKAKEHQSNTGFIVTTSVLPPFFNLAVSVRCKGSLTPLNILSGIFCTKRLWSYLVFCLPTLCHGPKSASMMSRHLWKSLRRFWRKAGKTTGLPAEGSTMLVHLDAGQYSYSLSSKSAPWFWKECFLPCENIPSHRRSGRIFFRGNSFSSPRSLLRPFVKVAGNQFRHKSRPQLFARDTGPLLHQWQHMCTVHLAHDLRLIDIYIYSTLVTLQWNLQGVVQILVLPPFPYLLHSSPASFAYFLCDFIVGFLCCPTGRCLVGWLFRFHHRRRGVSGQKLKVVMRITTRCHPDAVWSSPHPCHPRHPSKTSFAVEACSTKLAWFASSTWRREKATQNSTSVTSEDQTFHCKAKKCVSNNPSDYCVGLLRQTRNDQAVPKYHAWSREG